ncbi:hypothetical protein X742_12560 [Mesorhizobium sp. LNHC232B00]|nr:hypothetical protein X742_12560 [Mesorhizobium sp. LNHC232B00]
MPVLSARLSTAPCNSTISVGRPRRRSSHIDERASGSIASMRRAKSLNTQSGSLSTFGSSAGRKPATRAGSMPEAFIARSASSIWPARISRQRRSASSRASVRSESATSALFRFIRSLPHSTAFMSPWVSTASPSTFKNLATSRRPARPSSIITLPSLARCTRNGNSPSGDCTTLNGTMPASTV